MPLTKSEQVKWFSELDYWLTGYKRLYRDERGFIIATARTKTDLARKLKIHRETVYRWWRTRQIAPHFRRELVRNNIVRKEYV